MPKVKKCDPGNILCTVYTTKFSKLMLGNTLVMICIAVVFYLIGVGAGFLTFGDKIELFAIFILVACFISIDYFCISHKKEKILLMLWDGGIQPHIPKLRFASWQEVTRVALRSGEMRQIAQRSGEPFVHVISKNPKPANKACTVWCSIYAGDDELVCIPMSQIKADFKAPKEISSDEALLQPLYEQLSINLDAYNLLYLLRRRAYKAKWEGDIPLEFVKV